MITKVACLLVILGTALMPVRQQVFHYNVSSKSQIYLEGSTNVSRFDCFFKKNFSQGSIRIEENHGQWVKLQNVVLNLETESFDCKNKLMNKDLYKALQSEKYPFIKIELLQVKKNPTQKINEKDWVVLQADAILTMVGISKHLTIPIKAKKNQQQYHFIICQDILMTDFNICPPTALFGAVKVNDKITVHFDWVVDVW